MEFLAREIETHVVGIWRSLRWRDRRRAPGPHVEDRGAGQEALVNEPPELGCRFRLILKAGTPILGFRCPDGGNHVGIVDSYVLRRGR